MPLTFDHEKDLGRSFSDKYVWGSGDVYDSFTLCPSIIYGGAMERIGMEGKKHRLRDVLGFPSYLVFVQARCCHFAKSQPKRGHQKDPGKQRTDGKHC